MKRLMGDEFFRATKPKHPDGWWGLACFNGLSTEQQEMVVHDGFLPFGYRPAGTCPNGAEIEVTTMWDEFPGPRFYCTACAIEFLQGLSSSVVS